MREVMLSGALLVMWVGALAAPEDVGRLGACVGEVVSSGAPAPASLTFRCNGWPDRVFPGPDGARVPPEVKAGLRGILTWDEAEPHRWTRFQVIDGLAWAPQQVAAAGPLRGELPAGGGCAGAVDAAVDDGTIEVTCDGWGRVRLPAAGGGRLPLGLAIGARVQVAWDGVAWTMVVLADGRVLTPRPVTKVDDADIY